MNLSKKKNTTRTQKRVAKLVDSENWFKKNNNKKTKNTLTQKVLLDLVDSENWSKHFFTKKNVKTTRTHKKVLLD